MRAEGAAGRAGEDAAVAAQARSILLAYDGTDASRRALDAAADLTGYGSTLTVVGVRVADSELADARERLLLRHVVARFAAPTDELLAAVRDSAADLLVVGRAPADSPAGDALGAVVDGATCDVLVVA
jgi:nucleotide-binding universal stress UspA family protein